MTFVSKKSNAFDNPMRLYANVVHLFADHVNIHTIANKTDPRSLFSIHVYFSRLNDILEKRHHSKTLDQRYLARNCEYIKVYNYCKTHPKFNLAELSFGNGKGPLADIIGRKCSKVAYLSFRQGYKGWVEYFHEN